MHDKSTVYRPFEIMFIAFIDLHTFGVRIFHNCSLYNVSIGIFPQKYGNTLTLTATSERAE